MNLDFLKECEEKIKITDIFNEHTCTYCGEAASDKDHVIPRASEADHKKNHFNKKNTVPSCRECNLTLSSRYILTISDRSKFLIEAYTNKFKSLLAMPHHSDEDIKELEGSLKKSIKGQMKKKKIILERMSNLELIGLLEPEIKDVWQVIDRKGDFE